MKGSAFPLGLLQWDSHILLNKWFLYSHLWLWNLDTIHWGVCIVYVAIWISQKYLKIDALGQFLSHLEKGIVCFSYRVLLLFVQFFFCACVWVKICQGKAQQKKKHRILFWNYWNYEQLLLLCDLDLATLKAVTSLVVSVKIGCCRKAWTRGNGSSTLAKNNPRKTRFFWTGPFSSESGRGLW